MAEGSEDDEVGGGVPRPSSDVLPAKWNNVSAVLPFGAGRTVRMVVFALALGYLFAMDAEGVGRCVTVRLSMARGQVHDGSCGRSRTGTVGYLPYEGTVVSVSCDTKGLTEV